MNTTLALVICLIILAAILLAIILLLMRPAKRESSGICLWYAVDSDGTSCLYTHRPSRDTDNRIWQVEEGGYIDAGDIVDILPRLTWEDEPQKVTITIHDRHVHQ